MKGDFMINNYKYNKYPNPMFRRENFMVLNGEWDFEIINSDMLKDHDASVICGIELAVEFYNDICEYYGISSDWPSFNKAKEDFIEFINQFPRGADIVKNA